MKELASLVQDHADLAKLPGWRQLNFALQGVPRTVTSSPSTCSTRLGPRAKQCMPATAPADVQAQA